MTTDRKLLAVLIDADNIPAKHADAILREVKTYGEPALRRVYGDWSSPSLATWRSKVKELGLVANQETANTTGKNASDIGLVIDAMDILHTGRFDGFVLVSSDSDFTALANRLRENGVEVIGIGEEKAPVSLRNVCNRFIMIENIVDERKDNDEKPGASETSSKPITQPRKLIEMIRAAMRSIDPDGEWYRLSTIGSHLVRANPDFDSRTYGRAKLGDLVKLLTPFETRKSEGNHLEIREKAGD
jgi:uncharacterized protein (TIGR00288 family)